MFSCQNNLKTGIYRTNGPITNWKFRITLKQIYSLIELPMLDQNLEPETCKELSNSRNEQLVIVWQEKVFSRYELDYYSIKDNCKTELQRNYHHTIKSSGRIIDEYESRIFSYTDAENYTPDEELNHLAQISNNHLKQEELDFESMFIMADLETEVLLFTIKWIPKEKMLLVYPDFNCMMINPYYKEIRGDSRQMYHFGIKNLNLRRKLRDPSETRKLQNDLIDKFTKLSLRERLSQDKFLRPESHMIQILILLEVISVAETLYDNVHVRFMYNLPIGTKLLEGFIDGCTHSSKKARNVCNYSHCHELLLKVPDVNVLNDSVKIYFDIISIDNWRRERMLGNAYMNIPLESHTKETALQCVNIANDEGLYNKLETFLVGGRRKVKLNEFYGLKNDRLLNRYVCRSEFAGKLHIKYQVIQQHYPQIIEMPGSITKKYGKFRANVVTIEELLSSYHRARERLEEIVNLKY
ncbi:tectonic-like complex member MKS1 [Malaya genurostris]|uniref:tectonic-like complex member MKS1 n=1 Tax=Malaya genurostris TaxID=325434 RepID=UPI0026F3E298|nr:tectonic-like complex member MKS1 [Malaya genurostris]